MLACFLFISARNIKNQQHNDFSTAECMVMLYHNHTESARYNMMNPHKAISSQREVVYVFV